MSSLSHEQHGLRMLHKIFVPYRYILKKKKKVVLVLKRNLRNTTPKMTNRAPEATIKAPKLVAQGEIQPAKQYDEFEVMSGPDCSF